MEGLLDMLHVVVDRVEERFGAAAAWAVAALGCVTLVALPLAVIWWLAGAG